MDTLPVELLYAIFAQLQTTSNHKKDLASCSSVSQLWRQITQPQLFQKLCITYTQDDHGHLGCTRDGLQTAGEEGEEISQGKFLASLDETVETDDDLF